MYDIRPDISSKNAVIVLVCIVLLVLLVSRNQQMLMRTLADQQIRWKTAGFQEYQTRHFTVKYLPSDENYVKVVGEVAEDAYNNVGTMLGATPAARSTIIIYPDNESLAYSYGWEKDEKAMGVYWAGSIGVLSPQVWVETDYWQEQFIQEGPVYHEYTHLLVDNLTGGNYTRWFTEGLAQYVEKELTGFEFKDPFNHNNEIEKYTFKQLEKNFDYLDQKIAYWESLRAIEYIVNVYGEQGLFAIIENLSHGSDMGQAVEKGLGVDYGEFENNFYRSLLDIQG